MNTSTWQCEHLGVHWCAYDTLNAYLQDRSSHQPVWEAREAWAASLGHCIEPIRHFEGYCGVCEQLTLFDGHPGGTCINVRESLSCPSCQLNARLRASFNALSMLSLNQKRPAIYLTEQATPFYRAVKKHFSNVTGSEYFPKPAYERLSGYLKHLVSEQEWLRWEDVCALSFKDRSLDHVLSFEVLEHVPNYQAALTEFARVLKPGGRLILTVPFLNNSAQTVTRAKVLPDGTIEHLLEPEYHGDPVDGDGILAFYQFGWDLLDEAKNAGFQKAHWCLPWAPAQGLFAQLWTLIAAR